MDIHHNKMLCARLLARVRQAIAADVLADDVPARCARSAGAYGAAADLAALAESLGVLCTDALPRLCLVRQEQQLASLDADAAVALGRKLNPAAVYRGTGVGHQQRSGKGHKHTHQLDRRGEPSDNRRIRLLEGRLEEWNSGIWMQTTR